MTKRIDDKDLAGMSGGADGVSEIAPNQQGISQSGSGKTSAPPEGGSAGGGVDPDHDASGGDIGEFSN